MIQRFYDQVFQNMSRERRARKLAVMKALTRSSFNYSNKENEDPLNNNMELPYNFSHSTPLKSRKITDLDVMESDSELEMDENEASHKEESKLKEKQVNSAEEPQLVIAKVYDLVPSSDISVPENVTVNAEEHVSVGGEENGSVDEEENGTIVEVDNGSVGEEENGSIGEEENGLIGDEENGSVNEEENDSINVEENGSVGEKQDCNTEIYVPDISELNGKTTLESENKHWRSLDVLDETAEHEFCKSLEASKLFVSTSSLLEEIEADLPSSYSLLKPFNHTFHTLTTYRTVTRLARVDSNLTCPSILEQRESLEMSFPSKRQEYLEMEATVQKACIAQAEKALNLSKTQKFLGTEHLESEKTLLLANLRYNAAIQELGRLKMFGDVPERNNFGQITISDIYCTVDNSAENSVGYFLCTATDKEKVQCSSIVNAKRDGKLHFDGVFKFQNLGSEFVIYIELFKLYFKEPKFTILTTSLMRKFKKIAAINLNKSITDSSSTGNLGFICIACAELRLQQIRQRENEKCVLYVNQNLNQVVGNNISVLLHTDLNIQSTRRGFLNVFKQTWHRRWYLQSGYFLVSWLYPEDEEKNEPPIDTVYLPDCTSEARAVGFEVCVRPHSFVISCDQDKGKILFSADSGKEMRKWINHINLVIENIQLWKPKT